MRFHICLFLVSVFCTAVVSSSGFCADAAKNSAAVSGSELSSMYFLRDIADYGFTGDPVSLSYPYGLFVTKENHLLCAASGTVSEWDGDGRFVRSYGRRGEGRGLYTSAMKVFADGEGTVYVADMSGKIILYPRSGEPSEIALGQVENLLAVSDTGTVFISDRNAGLIRLVDRTGKNKGSISLNGDLPLCLAQGNGSVIVLAARGESYFLKHYASGGAFIRERELPVRDDDFVVTAMREDSDGNLFVLDMANRLVVKVPHDDAAPSVFSLAWSGPSGTIGNAYDLAVSSDGKTLYVADSLHKRIVVYGEFTKETVPGDLPGITSAAAKTKDSQLLLALYGENLRLDPMNTRAIAEYIRFYISIGASGQALTLCSRVPSDDPLAAKVRTSLFLAVRLRDAEGYAQLFRNAVASGDAVSAKIYYDESVRNFELALEKDPDDSAIKNSLSKLKSERASAVKSSSGIDVAMSVFRSVTSGIDAGVRIQNRGSAVIERFSVEASLEGFSGAVVVSDVYHDLKNGDVLQIPLRFSVKDLKQDRSCVVHVAVRYSVGGKEKLYTTDLKCALNSNGFGTDAK